MEAGPNWLARIELAHLITDYLRSLSPLVPDYVLTGAFSEGETYWIQTALAGTPASNLNPDQLQTLLYLNGLQAGQALSSEQNWSNYVTSVVFNDTSGWSYTLHNYSIETRELLSNLKRFVRGLEKICDKANDIVHGDLSLSNILIHNEQVSGVVDWDAAGCGDRAFDLALLFFYSYESFQIRPLLFSHIVEITGIDRLKVYTAYTILSQLDWSIRHHSKEAVDRFLKLANLILNDFNYL